MRKHTLTVNERELRVILSALDLAMEHGPPWWRNTQYVSTLYVRLRGHGLVSERAREAVR